MIATVLMVSLRRLLHNRAELLLTFVVPIAFFSIFALIFGRGVGSGNAPRIKVVVVDQAQSKASQAVATSLREMVAIRVLNEASAKPLSEQSATQMVRRGSASMAVVLRSEAENIAADLLSDTSDQVAPQIVSALVQRALLATRVPGPGPAAGAAVTQASAIEILPRPGIVAPTVRVIDILGGNKSNPVVSMYAAGIAVMFLLFGATGGGGALLEERENQTLDRLLTTGLSMDQLLLGKWFYLTALGVVQTSIMFLWGQIVFGIDLLGHLDGFLIMTLVTAGAAAAFGLLLATLCRTRGQLNGLSVIVVLTMSALGGSMVPRYVMSQTLRDAGLWTFNAWALDGYDKVFWRELPVADLWPQMGVLMACGAMFLVTARVLAIRWQTD